MASLPPFLALQQRAWSALFSTSKQLILPLALSMSLATPADAQKKVTTKEFCLVSPSAVDVESTKRTAGSVSLLGGVIGGASVDRDVTERRTTNISDDSLKTKREQYAIQCNYEIKNAKNDEERIAIANKLFAKWFPELGPRPQQAQPEADVSTTTKSPAVQNSTEPASNYISERSLPVLPGSSETQMQPEVTVNDPRMIRIQNKLNAVHGKGRPKTMLTTSYLDNRRDERRRVESILNVMLLEIGMEPVTKASRAYYQYKLNIESNASNEFGTVTEKLWLNLFDVGSGTSERLIMTSSATITCSDRTSNGPRYKCPVDEKQIQEIFLRLR